MIRIPEHKVLSVDTNINGKVYPRKVVQDYVDNVYKPITIRYNLPDSIIDAFAHIATLEIIDNQLLATVVVDNDIALYDYIMDGTYSISKHVAGQIRQFVNYKEFYVIDYISFEIKIDKFP